MNKMLRLAAAAALMVGITVAWAGPAHAVHAAAYCAPTTTSGEVSYSPGVTLAPQPNTWNMQVSCFAEPSTGEQGTIDEAGWYFVTLNAFSPLASVADEPTFNGSIGGSGPEGSINGTFSGTRQGIHYYINGEYFTGGGRHRFNLWMDQISCSPSATFYNHCSLTGHGAWAWAPL
jgi:hypothetical protein